MEDREKSCALFKSAPGRGVQKAGQRFDKEQARLDANWPKLALQVYPFAPSLAQPLRMGALWYPGLRPLVEELDTLCERAPFELDREAGSEDESVIQRYVIEILDLLDRAVGATDGAWDQKDPPEVGNVFVPVPSQVRQRLIKAMRAYCHSNAAACRAMKSDRSIPMDKDTLNRLLSGTKPVRQTTLDRAEHYIERAPSLKNPQ